MMTNIELENVILGYRRKPVLYVENINIGKGITCILGPNGAGKTTFLRGVTGVLKPLKGKIKINGIDLFAPKSNTVRSKIGFLPENSYPYPTLKVKEYLEYWADFYKVSKNKIEEVMDMMNIKDIANKYGHSLSQGQKRRTMIARLFLIDPKILILDEPTANLDPEIAMDVMNIITKFGKSIPVIYSTHHLKEIENVFDRVLIIKNRKIMGDYLKDEIPEDLYRFYARISKGG